YSERVSNREHVFADLQQLRIAELRTGQVDAVDLDYRKVRFGIGADHAPIVLLASRGRNVNYGRSGNDVIVRHNEAVRADNDAGTFASPVELLHYRIPKEIIGPRPPGHRRID